LPFKKSRRGEKNGGDFYQERGKGKGKGIFPKNDLGKEPTPLFAGGETLFLREKGGRVVKGILQQEKWGKRGRVGGQQKEKGDADILVAEEGVVFLLLAGGGLFGNGIKEFLTTTTGRKGKKEKKKKKRKGSLSWFRSAKKGNGTVHCRNERGKDGAHFFRWRGATPDVFWTAQGG